MRLTLPLPPSPNRLKRNPFALQAQKDEYREACWIAALRQSKPDRDPPTKVALAATFYLARTMRDEDNLRASLKFPLDALRQKQTGAMRWRNGLADKCGYFVDDDPGHLTIALVEQVKVSTVKEERLVLTLESAA